MLYLMVKVRCPYHVPLQRFRLSKLSQKHSEMGVSVLNWPELEEADDMDEGLTQRIVSQ